MEPTTLTVKELAVYLRCHMSTIYRLVKKKRIPCWKLGADYRFNKASIDKWKEQMEAEVWSHPKP